MREIPVFFIGTTPGLAERLESCYQNIVWDPAYRVQPIFRVISPGPLPALLEQGEGLVFIEILGDASQASTLAGGVRKLNPRLQLVLLADDDIDYFRVAQECHIGNILKKGLFDLSIVRALSVRLLTGNIFGFDPYFPRGFTLGPLIRTYAGPVHIHEVIQDAYDFFGDNVPAEAQPHFRMFLHELLTNTFAYAIEGITPEDRDRNATQPNAAIFIPERKGIKVSLTADAEKVGVSVQDSTGNLNLLRVLEKLRRQSRIAGEATPPGLLDETGRGMSLVYRYSRFIVNILLGVRTETIFLQYHREELNRFESVIVTEVTPSHLS